MFAETPVYEHEPYEGSATAIEHARAGENKDVYKCRCSVTYCHPRTRSILVIAVHSRNKKLIGFSVSRLYMGRRVLFQK